MTLDISDMIRLSYIILRNSFKNGNSFYILKLKYLQETLKWKKTGYIKACTA